MYTIDRIEQNIVILENRETSEMIEINIKELPNNIQEGDILNIVNNKYVLYKKTKMIKESIKERFNKLKK